MLKRILILSYSHLNSDPRIIRQIKALSEFYDIETCALSSSLIDGIPFYQIKQSNEIDFHYNYPVLIRKIISFGIKILYHIHFFEILKYLKYQNDFEKKYWHFNNEFGNRNKTVGLFAKKEFDLIIANDINTVPLAIKIAKSNVKIIADLHEYSPKEFEDNSEWIKNIQPLNEYLCRFYLPKCEVVSTVGKYIADEYKKNFNIRKTIVITNATDYSNLKPKQSEKNKIKLIHHGICIQERHLELMIEMMDYLDERFFFDFMLIPTQMEYYESLKVKSANNPKIKFIEPVFTEEIPFYINKYDLGVFILKPTNFNYKYALPNKFFEYIQARLGIVIGPSIEMAELTKKYDLGIVAENFNPQAMAEALNKLSSEKINYYKEQSNKFAFELSAEKNKQLLLQTVADLLN